MSPRNRSLPLLILLAFCLSACARLGVDNDVALPVDADGTDSEVAPEPLPSVSSEPVTVATATLRAHELTLKEGQIGRVPLDVTLSNGSSYRKISALLATPYGLNETVGWNSDDEAVVTVGADGTLTGIAPGTATIEANVTGAADAITVTVVSAEPKYDAINDANATGSGSADPKNQDGTDLSGDSDGAGNGENDTSHDASSPIPPEDPVDPSDRFLNANDTITIEFGEDGGFGATNMPDVFYGPPVSSRTDVVSLGLGGEFTVELGGYAVVDGNGDDFTIFENAFSGWTEPGFVAVSTDGDHYVTFPCAATDGYTGCAGLTEVGYSDDDDAYLNPLISGGDGFDLAEVGFASVRFIKITDANDCDNPVVCVPDKAGFDLDAIAIVNGAEY